jgi:hypothetical protein
MSIELESVLIPPVWTGHDMPIQIAREILFGKPQNAH